MKGARHLVRALLQNSTQFPLAREAAAVIDTLCDVIEAGIPRTERIGAVSVSTGFGRNSETVDALAERLAAAYARSLGYTATPLKNTHPEAQRAWMAVAAEVLK